jgi:hypothetical protein
MELPTVSKLTVSTAGQVQTLTTQSTDATALNISVVSGKMP